MAKHKNRGGRGLLGSARVRDSIAWDTAHFYRTADRCGGQPRNFFEKGARRFFNSRVTSVYPVDAKNATYFVESFGGGDTPVGKSYRVGVLKNCKVTILGKGAVGQGKKYATSAQARRIAERAAYPSRRKNARRRKASR